MKKFIFAFAVAFPFVLFYSCKHDPILPDHEASFHDDIIPIINSSCMHSGCHNDTDHAESHTMNSYEEVMAGDYIIPGKPHASKFYNSIVGAAGEERMPRDPYEPLNNEQIRKIFIWIAQGAKDN